MGNEPLISIKSLKKTFKKHEHHVEVLKGVDFTMTSTDKVSVMGESGSGKTTLLNILGLLEDFDGGQYFFDHQDVSTFNDDEKNNFRQNCVSYIFQDHLLMPQYNVLDNVLLPLFASSNSLDDEKILLAKTLIDHVGLSHRVSHLPEELSGGEAQRVAIARSLITEPQVLLADEPTGSLDGENSSQVMKLILEMCDQQKTALVLVTHSDTISKSCDRCVTMRDGILS